MTRLLVAELRRIAARRLVRVTIVLAAVGIVVGGGVTFLSTGALSQSAYEQRVADADAARSAIAADAQNCLRAHGVDPSSRDEVSNDVAKACFPQSVANADDSRFHRKNLQGLLQGVSGGLAIVGWTLGASLVGAEFASRSMTTLLTWEPRRLRVFLAKVATVLVANATFALVALLGFVIALLPSLLLHGGPVRANDPSVATLAGIVLRGTAITAAALGAGFAYIVVFENIVGSYKEGTRRWLLLGNVIVFMSGDNNGGDIPGRTVTAAAVILVLVATAFLAGAYGMFRTRDIA